LLRLMSNIQTTGFICDSKNRYKLDLDKVMRSDEITTFSLGELENDSFKFLVFVTIMRKVIDLRYNRNYPKQLILIVPELSEFAPSKSSISPAAVGGFSSLTIMQLISRRSRILGITLVADTQIPQQCDRVVLANFGWVVIGNSTKEAVDWVHKNVVRVEEEPDRFPTLQKGVWYVSRMGGKDYSYPVFVAPCLARHKRPREDARDWVSKQRGIKTENYFDYLSNPLFVNIGKPLPKVTGRDSKRRMDRLFIFLAKQVPPVDLTLKEIVEGMGEVDFDLYTVKSYFPHIRERLLQLGYEFKKIAGDKEMHLVR